MNRRMIDALANVSYLKEAADEATAAYKQAQTELIALYVQHGETKVEAIREDGVRVHGTLVESSTLNIDEAKLARRLGASMWNRVTTRALDRRKLDAYLASGEVKATDVAMCSEEVPRAPYIKITKK